MDRADDARLRIALLGPPQVTWEGRPLSLARRQVRALLYRLAAEPGPVSREHLCHLFWPDADPTAAHANLSRLLYHLQQALPDPAILRREETRVGLESALIWVDLRAVEDALSAPHTPLDVLREAARLYRGPFLNGFDLPRFPAYQTWIEEERQHWEQRILELLNRLVAQEEAQGRLEAAVTWARRYLEIDPLAEEMHARLIRLFGALGDREAAVRQFETCVKVLERELGVRPLPETRAIFEAVLHGTEPQPAPRATDWALSGGPEVPFVDREEALEALKQAWIQVRTGRGTVVTITGEAGMGKTRLLQVFVSGLSPGTRVVCVQANEADQDVPYGALVKGLQALLPHVAWDRVSMAGSLLAMLTRILPEIRRYRSHPTPAQSLSPQEERALLDRALDEFLWALARAHPPLVLCLDNVHWLDDASRAWLRRWLPTVRRQPLLVLATYRDEHEDRLEPLWAEPRRRGELREIRLQGLDAEALATLASHILGDEDLARSLAPQLHRQTGGNPFFALEILRDLVESGVRGLAPAAARDLLACWPCPTSVEEVIRRRLARLSPRERRVLEAAATLGASFAVQLLAPVSGLPPQTVLDTVESLAARGLLQEEDHTCRFVHGLVRQQLQEEMLHSRRRLLHRRAARALQRLAPQEVEAIARHLQAAGELAEAAQAWREAGDRARRLHAYREAIRHYERALALHRTLDQDEAAAEILLRLGLCHHMAADFARAARSYEAGFQIQQRLPLRMPSRHPAFQPLRVDWPHLDTLDPCQAQDANTTGVLEHILAGLTEWDPDLNVVPDGARSWEILEDGRRYVFQLRSDRTWSDGYPVVAQDYVAAWRRLLHPGGRSPYARIFYPIRGAACVHRGEEDALLGVQALDDLTLVVDLEHPCVFFPHLTAHPAARPVPSHRLGDQGDGWWHPDVLVSNGPFRLVAWKDNRVVLARATHYWGRWPGNVEEVILHLGNSSTARQAKWRLYTQDGLDVFALRWGLPAGEMAAIRRRHSREQLSGPNFFVRFLGFQVRCPPFHDLRVRRAVALATDRMVLASILWGDLEPAWGGFLPPGMPGHTPDSGPPFDPEEARSLLAAAGYPGGRGFPEVTLQIFTGAEELGSYLQRMWHQSLGIEVELEILPWSNYVACVEQGAATGLFLGGWLADYPDPDSFLRVAPLESWTGWRDVTYTRLVEQALTCTEPEERLRLYRMADAILMEALPILPLAYSRWSFLLKPWVRTFPLSPLKWWYWKDVVLEPSSP